MSQQENNDNGEQNPHRTYGHFSSWSHASGHTVAYTSRGTYGAFSMTMVLTSTVRMAGLQGAAALPSPGVMGFPPPPPGYIDAVENQMINIAFHLLPHGAADHSGCSCQLARNGGAPEIRMNGVPSQQTPQGAMRHQHPGGIGIPGLQPPNTSVSLGGSGGGSVHLPIPNQVPLNPYQNANYGINNQVCLPFTPSANDVAWL